MEPMVTHLPIPPGPGPYRLLAERIDEGNRPLLVLASWCSQVRLDPALSLLPGTELLQRALAALLFHRHALKGTIQRALAGAAPGSTHEGLAYCTLQADRAAEQVRALLDWMQRGAGPAALPLLDEMAALLAAERTQFRELMALVDRILGPDRQVAERSVLEALTAMPVRQAPG